MIDTLLALVPAWGTGIVALATFLSCLALPIPSSLIMLTAGAFVAAGDLSLAATAGAAFAGAVAGDQAGYAAGRWGGARLDRLMVAGSAPARRIARARTLAERWGGPGVFLSRWLFSPLGPYMNFVAGAARLDWAGFTAWGTAGEAIWVAVYVGTGFAFAGQIEAAADILGNFSGALAAGAVALMLGLWLRAALRADRATRDLSRDAP